MSDYFVLFLATFFITIIVGCSVAIYFMVRQLRKWGAFD